MSPDELLLWARGLVTAESFVLHTELGIVGRAAQTWAPGDYQDENGRQVSRAVLSLDNGNAFVLREDAATVILELTPGEVELHERLVSDLAITLTGALVEAGQKTKDPMRFPIVMAVLGAALAAQLRTLRTGKG